LDTVDLDSIESDLKILSRGRPVWPMFTENDRYLFNTLSYPKMIDLPDTMIGLDKLKRIVFLNTFGVIAVSCDHTMLKAVRKSNSKKTVLICRCFNFKIQCINSAEQKAITQIMPKPSARLK
jgi:hypothetical protein